MSNWAAPGVFCTNEIPMNLRKQQAAPNPETLGKTSPKRQREAEEQEVARTKSESSVIKIESKSLEQEAPSSLMVIVENNMCGGGGFQQNFQVMLPWTKQVQQSIVGQKFQANETWVYLSCDVSVRSLASEESKAIYDFATTLTTIDGNVLCYDNEGDDTENDARVSKLNTLKPAMCTRFAIIRMFT